MLHTIQLPKSYTVKLESLIGVRLIALEDYLGIKSPICDNRQHLKMVVEWLKNAQDATGAGGVSAYFVENKGWETSYPETTGYIIPSMFDYYYFSSDTDCKERAIRMSDFLLDAQLDDGSFRLGFHPSRLGSEVFDTGQCIQGFVRCYKETRREKYLLSAVEAGDWVVSVQDEDGAWRKCSFHGIPHTYYTRVAIALLELYEILGEKKYKEAAVKNVEWASANSNKVGWYHNCAFNIETMAQPITHVIGYTAEGILECGIKLDDNKLIQTATRTLGYLLRKFNIDGWLRGSYDECWQSQDSYSCLTGDAQIAALWFRLFELTEEQAYFDGAVKLNNYIKSTQRLNHWCKGIKGGIKGSQPIYGKYISNGFVNWAAKFFVDSLLMQERAETR
jgi:uncharacterized protein YyaL (SSP411 family)